MLFWTVWHDRPQLWACRRDSYSSLFRPRKLPSYSEFNRRIRTERFAQLLARVFAALAAPDGEVCLLDARPLPVGGCSKDRAARPGHVYGGFARGYRLHVLMTEKGVVFAWKLTAMNVAEAAVARQLLPQAPAGSTVLADSAYDRTPLYEQAAACGVELRAKPKKNAGCGHRRHSPVRLAAIAAWQAAPPQHAARRGQVERGFGWQSSFGGGLSPLPAWVRTPARVTRWVQIKMIINHVRLLQKERVA